MVLALYNDIGYPCSTSANVSKYGHTSNLEIHLRRIPCSDLNGTRRMWVCSVPLTLSSLWLQLVPFESGINLVTFKNRWKMYYRKRDNQQLSKWYSWSNGPKISINALTIRILGLKSNPCCCILRSISFSRARTWSRIYTI